MERVTWMGKQLDFTTGNIWRHMIVFSGPIMLTNLLQTSYQIVDSLWIGNLLGSQALGAVSIASSILFTVLSFIIGLNNASLTILSQQRGMNNKAGIQRYLNAFIVVLSTMAIAFSMLGFIFSYELLLLLGTPADIMDQAQMYLQINFIGMLFLFGYNYISTVLRALGDSKSPLRFVGVAVSLNIVLDPLFIAGFNLGIRGAACATIVAQGSAFLYGLMYVLRKKAVPFTKITVPKKEEIALILRLGIPAGLQMSVISAGSAAIMSVVTGFGSSVVAGFGAAQRLNSLIMLPATALGTAVNSMAGQNIGIKQWNRVQMIASRAVLYNFSIMISLGFILYIAAPHAIQLFVQDSESVAFGAKYLRIMAFCYPFLGVNFVLNGIVRSSGAMYQVLILNIISFWVLRYPFTAMFAQLYDELGIPLGIGLSFIVSCFVATMYYKYGKWREKEIFVRGK